MSARGAIVWIDHDAEEEAIVEAISVRLAPADALGAGFDETETFCVEWRGAPHPIPLSFSPHDRYILISSLAAMLRERYRFYLLTDTLSEASHGLIVLPAGDTAPEGAAPLELGVDYFEPGMRLPYLGRLDNNPDFARAREQYAQERQAAGAELQHWLETDPGMQRIVGDLRADIGRGGRRHWWRFW